jgi:D-inositol-3-phosphate glycosyltransferase
MGYVSATVVPLARAALARAPRRVAMLSLHTSPLEQPGSGDAGGLNVYVVELSRRLAARGTEVEIFTRATSSRQDGAAEVAPGVRVRTVPAGPFEGLAKEELPAQLCAFTSGVLAEEARHPRGYYDAVHSHYWLSGQVGWVAAHRWGVPLVHSAHTLAKVKNADLAVGDRPEPRARVAGEQQIVDVADRLVAATSIEAAQLVDLYGADPARIATVAPGVDLDLFRPGDAGAARNRLGLAQDAVVLVFAGRVQRLKAPDVLLRAAAALAERDPALRERLQVLIVGGTSGADGDALAELHALARQLGIAEKVRFLPPQPQRRLAEVFRAADVVAVPSYNESFGLVAIEAQACARPVVATDVGGLRTAVADGVSGRLVRGHDPRDWATALATAWKDREVLGAGAVRHAAAFSWDRTAEGVLNTYRAATAGDRSTVLPLVRAGAGAR